MALVISDSIIRNSQLSEPHFAVELACWMYQKEFFTLGRAAEFCNLSQMEMMQELGNRNIRWNYGVEELREDLADLQTIA